MEPTIHEGYCARKMEKAGFVSNRCEYNRIVRKLNELKGRWLLAVKALPKTIMERGRALNHCPVDNGSAPTGTE